MASEKITRLIKSLIQKTAAGSLKWEKTSVADFFQAPFPRYSVLVGRKLPWGSVEKSLGNALLGGHNAYPIEQVVLQIGNEEGQIIEEVSETEVPELPELFAMARRNAAGVDRVLDDIIGYLEEKK